MVNDGSYWTPNYAEPTIAELAYRLDEAGITDVSSSLYYLNSILAKKADINYNLHRVLSIISVLDPAIIFQIKIRSPSQPQGS
jgi:hypothetical protein